MAGGVKQRVLLGRSGRGELRRMGEGLVKGINWYAGMQRNENTQLTGILSGERRITFGSAASHGALGALSA